MNPMMLEDAEYLAKSGAAYWETLAGKTVFISGATGLLGSQTVLALDAYNRIKDGKITIYAHVRNKAKAEKLFAGATDHLKILCGDMTEPVSVDGEIDYIIHAASMTSSKDFVEKPVETIMTGITATNNYLKLAADKKVRGFLYLSSLEAYGVIDPPIEKVTEEDYGRINQLSVRSSYSEGKRMAECLVASYASEYGVPAKIVRLCQTFGPGISYDDGRVFAQFARAAIEGTDIVLKTKGETYRNYCYTRDAVAGMLTVLTRGEVGEAYNIAAAGTGISIADMAHMIADEFGEGRTKVVFDIAEDATKLGYNPKIVIELDTQKTERLSWRSEIGLKESFERLIAYMKSIRA